MLSRLIGYLLSLFRVKSVLKVTHYRVPEDDELTITTHLRLDLKNVKPKQRFKSMHSAKKAIRAIYAKTGASNFLTPVYCSYCDGYHLRNKRVNKNKTK